MKYSENYKLSVIIPVYNIQDYIEKNINSLISQKISMEIIYVDDGSKDNSVKIIEKYLSEDNRIRLIHKENGGLSSARNFGLLNSRGKYIIFIDGDDYIEQNSLNYMYNIAEKEDLDILQGCYRKVYDDSKEIVENYESGVSNINDILSGEDWLVKKNVIPMAWLYMYKRDFLLRNNLVFKNGIYHEDLEFTPRAIYFAKRIKAINNIFYNYVQRDNSIINTKNIKKCFDLILVADSIKEFKNLNIKNNNKMLLKYFENYIIFLYSNSIHSALVQNIPLKELLEDHSISSKVIKEIGNSKEIKYQIMSKLIKCKLYCLYSLLYKIKIKFKKG